PHTTPHFFCHCSVCPPALHSFPTRRSSDLPGVMGMITQQFSQLAEQAYSVVWGGVFLWLINPVLAYLLAAYMVPYTLVGWFMYEDRKSTRLNSSHVKISYAVFCLKKKTIIT